MIEQRYEGAVEGNGIDSLYNAAVESHRVDFAESRYLITVWSNSIEYQNTSTE